MGQVPGHLVMESFGGQQSYQRLIRLLLWLMEEVGAGAVFTLVEFQTAEFPSGCRKQLKVSQVMLLAVEMVWKP